MQMFEHFFDKQQLFNIKWLKQYSIIIKQPRAVSSPAPQDIMLLQ